jgi:hypothetical protein
MFCYLFEIKLAELEIKLAELDQICILCHVLLSYKIPE